MVYTRTDTLEYIIASLVAGGHVILADTYGVGKTSLARALALIRGSSFVPVDLVKELFHPVVSHRVIMKDPSRESSGILDTILGSVPVQTE